METDTSSLPESADSGSTPAQKKSHRYRRDASSCVVLTERDLDVLFWVYKLRYATVDQIRRVLFASSKDHKIAYTRMRKLFDGGYLDREKPPSVYQPDPYFLTIEGWRTIESDERLQSLNRNWRSSRLTDIAHHLTTAEIWATLSAAALGANHTLDNWYNDLETVERFQYYNQKTHKKENCVLSPDAFFTWEYEAGGRRRYFNAFLETDRKTEANSFGLGDDHRRIERSHKNVISAKCYKYLAFQRQMFQERYGREKFRVLFIIESKRGTTRDQAGSLRRVQNMKTAVEDSVDLSNNSVSFWFTTLDQLKAEPLGSIWVVAGSDAERSIIRVSDES